MSEPSPRPWRVNVDGDLFRIVDANGEPIVDTARYVYADVGAANAALIVAAVNAAWEREQNPGLQLRPHVGTSALPSNHSGPCVPEHPYHSLARVALSTDCRLPLAHAPGCECARL